MFEALNLIQGQLATVLPKQVWSVWYHPDIDDTWQDGIQTEFLIALCKSKRPALRLAQELATKVSFKGHDRWESCKLGHVSAVPEEGIDEYWAVHKLEYGPHNGWLEMQLADYDWQREHFVIMQIPLAVVTHWLLEGPRKSKSPR